MIYADNAATTPVDARVLGEYVLYDESMYGNPSSKHPMGRQAKRAVEDAREYVRKFFNADGYHVVFNSGATEGDNTAIISAMRLQRASGKNHIVISAMEHPAVYNMCLDLSHKGFDVAVVNPDRHGVVRPEDVERAITDKTGLVSIMMVNNEIGTLQPVKEIASIAHEHTAFFHTDAVQAVGHIKIDLNDIGADILTFTGHKIYGPKGIGCMLYRKDYFRGIFKGGTQENGFRPGTENVSGIVGLKSALKMIEENRSGSPATKTFISEMKKCAHSVVYNVDPSTSIADIISLRFPGIRGEDAVILLGESGLCVSAGSACSSGSHAVSRTLKSIGLTDKEASETIRISFGRFNTASDGIHAAHIIMSTLGY